MNVMGVQYPGNNLPEANTRNYRVDVRRKEDQDNNLEWLQKIYETYSRYLNHYAEKLKDPANAGNQELIELHIDCLEKVEDIRKKIDVLTIK